MMAVLNAKSFKSKTIKIAFITTGLATGGAEMMLFKLLTRIDRNKFSPIVVSIIAGGKFVDRIKALNIPVYFLGMRRGRPNPLGVLKLIKILNKIKPDLIQGWMYHGNLIALIGNYLTKNKIPVLWSIHHTVDSLKNEKVSLATIIKVTSILSEKVTKVIFSSHIGQVQHLHLGYDVNNALTINDNFDISFLDKPSGFQANMSNSIRLPKDSIVIGSLARYHPMKDHLNLISSASKMVKVYPELHFVLAGVYIDTDNDELMSRILHFGIEDRVHLLGEIQYVPEFMTSLNIFTSSSAFGESFPNVIGEAMTCRTPCVVTDVGDSKFIVGDTGIVIPPRNQDALIEAWSELIEIGEAERQKLGRKARIRIREYFDIDSPNSFVKKYEEVYEEATSSPK